MFIWNFIIEGINFSSFKDKFLILVSKSVFINNAIFPGAKRKIYAFHVPSHIFQCFPKSRVESCVEKTQVEQELDGHTFSNSVNSWIDHHSMFWSWPLYVKISPWFYHRGGGPGNQTPASIKDLIHHSGRANDCIWLIDLLNCSPFFLLLPIHTYPSTYYPSIHPSI